MGLEILKTLTFWGIRPVGFHKTHLKYCCKVEISNLHKLFTQSVSMTLLKNIDEMQL